MIKGIPDGGPSPPFRPAWWLPGPHPQTVWRRVFGSRPVVQYQRERFETSDGDFVDLDWHTDAPAEPKAPLLLVLHGLEGSSRSPYVEGLLNEGASRGWAGVALNFRSCSGELNRLPRFYHSGETDDLDQVVAALIRRSPERPIALAGYSLGGNVLLKWLGERGNSLPASIRGAAAVSVPYDLAAAAHRIDHGISRIYAAVFLKTLRKKAIAKARRFPGILDPEEVARIRSFTLFDDRVTAPLHGFSSGRDYWERACSLPWLEFIRTSTLLLNAFDDPFLPSGLLPRKIAAGSPWLSTEFTPRGGHAGFVEGRFPGAASYWADRRIMSHLESLIATRGPKSLQTS